MNKILKIRSILLILIKTVFVLTIFCKQWIFAINLMKFEFNSYYLFISF